MESDSESSGSSANEYAEGLGYRGGKRRRLHRSGFEFDNRPDEEYFSEPKPYRDATSADQTAGMLPAPAPRSSGGAAARRPIGVVLSALEEAELEEEDMLRNEGRREDARYEQLEGQLARVARRCDQRCAARSAARSAESDPSDHPVVPSAVATPTTAASRVVNVTKRKLETSAPLLPLKEKQSTTVIHRVLKDYTQELASLRARLQGRHGRPSDLGDALRILEQLDSIDVDTKLLKVTGIGLELNTATWRRHDHPAVSKKSRALVSKWRSAYRAQCQRDVQRGACGA